MTTYRQLILLASLFVTIAFGRNTIVAQEPIQPRPSTKITFDEDILTTLIEDTCHHFEAARDQFIKRQYPKTAEHLRTASANLRLEAARASHQERAVLNASVRELQAIAVAVERDQIRSVEALEQTFARAHFALASHHCVESAHRCCQPATLVDKDEMIRAGRDLRAAAIHVERGLRWTGDDSDEETKKALRASQLAAENLIRQESGPQNDAQRVIHRLHTKLEALTRRKIMLARPLTREDDQRGPSIFR